MFRDRRKHIVSRGIILIAENLKEPKGQTEKCQPKSIHTIEFSAAVKK